MFNIGPAELTVIAIVALIFIRPKDLPAILRKVMKAWREIKKSIDELTAMKDDFMRQVNDLSKEVEDATLEVKDALRLQEERAAKDGQGAPAPAVSSPAGPVAAATPEATDQGQSPSQSPVALPGSPFQEASPETLPLASFDASAPQESFGYGGAKPEPEQDPSSRE